MVQVVAKNLEVFSDAIVGLGGTRGEGDQHGALLAGAWALRSQKVATAQEVSAWLQGQDWRKRIETGESDDDLCLRHLFGHIIQMPDGERKTVVSLALDGDSALETYGMKRSHGMLMIHQTSTYVASIYRETKWAGTQWRGALKRVPMAVSGENHRIGRQQGRVICVPLPQEG
jgi:hypothetical protein